LAYGLTVPSTLADIGGTSNGFVMANLGGRFDHEEAVPETSA
jgi:hypothetical protein